MFPELAPELLEIIFGVILADSGDTATLRACSLAIPHHTTLFQSALCSKKPLILSFTRNADKNPRLRKMINTLVDLLDVNPRFGACLGPDVRFHFYANHRSLSDSRAAKIARCCSTDSGIVRLTIKITGGRGSWADFSDENRKALQGVIVHSPRLQILKLESMGIPWAVFLRSRPFLESLVLQNACPTTPTPPWSIPLPGAKPNEAVFKPSIRIGCMTASPAELHRLAEVLFCTPDVDGKDILSSAIDFGHLRGIETACDNNGAMRDLRHVLHHTSRLEELTLRTFDGNESLKGLFDKPHSAYLSHLRHLTFAQTFYYMDSNFLPTLVSVLSHLPPTNVLETLLVEVLVSPYSGHALKGSELKKKEEMMVLLELLTRCRFPSLNKVTVIIIVLIDNVTSISSDTRIRQLTEQKEELEWMKWDFGSLFIDIRERHESFV